ncbi:MAG: hypothetical protein U1F35_21035 [Steroidobacteraceae bacterium]
MQREAAARSPCLPHGWPARPVLEQDPSITGETCSVVLLAADSPARGHRCAPVGAARFLKLPNAPNLAAANSASATSCARPRYRTACGPKRRRAEEPERALHAAIERAQPGAEAIAGKRYREALTLTTLRGSVDAFFDSVMVMDENAAAQQPAGAAQGVEHAHRWRG